MNKWQQLPSEILNTIFAGINKRDCIQCSKTCKTWNVVARPILFKSLNSLTDLKVHRFKSVSMYKALQPLQDFVKIVFVCRLSDNFDVKLLDSAFPYIEVINFNSFQEMIHKNICRLILKGGFPKLKEIPLIKWDKDYWELVFARRNKIKHLRLLENSNNGDLIGAAIEKIHQFTRLESLKVEMNSNRNLEDLLPENLSTLRSIDFEFKSPSKLIFDAHLIDVEPLERIKEVKIKSKHLFADGCNSYLNFMKKFPNLEILVLDLRRTTDELYMFHPAAFMVVSGFLQFLAQVKWRSHAYPITTNQCTPEYIQDFLTRLYASHSPWKNNVQFHLNILFEPSRWTRMGFDPPEDTKCNLRFDQEYSHNIKVCKIDAIYEIISEDTTAFKPCLELLQRIGSMNIESLTIGPRDWEDDILDIIPIPFDTILEHCTKLKSLELCQVANISFSEIPSIVSNVQALKFKRCTLFQWTLSDVGRICPNLKLLDLDNSRFAKRSEDPPHHPLTIRDVQINMRSTSLNELRVSVYTRNPMQPRYPRAFIRLKTATKKTRYSKIKWKRLEFDEPDYSKVIDKSKRHYTEEDYRTSAFDKKCSIYSFHCKTVTKLVVRTEEQGDVKTVYLEEDKSSN